MDYKEEPDDEFKRDDEEPEAPFFRHDAVQAHRAAYPLVMKQVEKAEQKLKSGDYDETVFHASRAFEHYCHNVFVGPLRQQAMWPLWQEVRSDENHVKKIESIVRKPTSLSSDSYLLISLGLIAKSKADHTFIQDVGSFIGSKGETPS